MVHAPSFKLLSQATKISGEVNGEELLKEIQRLHEKVELNQITSETNKNNFDESKFLELEEKLTKLAEDIHDNKNNKDRSSFLRQFGCIFIDLRLKMCQHTRR